MRAVPQVTLHLKEDQLEFLDERRLKVCCTWTRLPGLALDRLTVLHPRIKRMKGGPQRLAEHQIDFYELPVLILLPRQADQMS